MSDEDPGLAERAAELRRAFDRSFAESPRTEARQLEDFLAVRVAADPYAIRLVEISGLFVDKTVTRLPNTVPEFLGIAGFRGSIVPVYDLRALLDYSVADAPRWLAIAAQTPVALAFDAFDGYLRLPREAVMPEERGQRPRQHIHGALRAGDLVRPVVDLASILESIKKRAQKGARSKEES